MHVILSANIITPPSLTEHCFVWDTELTALTSNKDDFRLRAVSNVVLLPC